MANPKIKFETTLSTFGDGMWVYIPVAPDIPERLRFPDKKFKRVVCTVNGRLSFQCALMPSGSGGFIITVNKKKRDEHGLRVGDTVSVELVRDESRYGLPMPEEFREVLAQDAEAGRLFHALTPGKQRSLLYQANQKVDVDLRIHRALAIVEHLKENDGQVIWQKLDKELKRPPAEQEYKADRKRDFEF